MRTLIAAAMVVFALILAAGCNQAGQTGHKNQPASSGSSSNTSQQHASSPATASSSNGTGGSIKSATSGKPGNTKAINHKHNGSAANANNNGARKATKGSSSSQKQAARAGFTASPGAQGGTAGAADSIRDVRFGSHGSYERAVIDFTLNGAAASHVPRWKLSSPTGEGYSRISFPGLKDTSVTDGSFGGSIMDDYYVVRAPEGGFFMDLFAKGAFQYRVFALSDPGRLVVDYRPASVNLSYPLPVRSEKVVVMQPRKGEKITSPLRVSGYSRFFEGSTTMILKKSQGGNILARKTVEANDWSKTWGYFQGTLSFPSFSGRAILEVGTQSPKNGAFEGVKIPVKRAQ